MSSACTTNGYDEPRGRRFFRALCAIAGLTAAAGTNVRPAGAQAHQSIRSYLVTYTIETATGTAKSSETLTLRSGTVPALVSVSNATGASLSLPTAFAADGEILENGADPSVICYNMATAFLAQNRRDPAAQSYVVIAVGDGAVPVPLTLHRPAASAIGLETIAGTGQRSVTLRGATAAVNAHLVVDAHLSSAAGELRDATFNEATFLGTPAKTLSRVTCSLSRLQTSDA